MHPKNFLVKIYAYQYSTEFTINCMEGPLDIDNAIIDRLGKSDITWDYLGEMHDPRVNRITYEEVINGGDNATSGKPIFSQESIGSRMGAGASERG